MALSIISALAAAPNMPQLCHMDSNSGDWSSGNLKLAQKIKKKPLVLGLA